VLGLLIIVDVVVRSRPHDANRQSRLVYQESCGSEVTKGDDSHKQTLATEKGRHYNLCKTPLIWRKHLACDFIIKQSTSV
jgi:hypothetical protein